MKNPKADNDKPLFSSVAIEKKGDEFDVYGIVEIGDEEAPNPMLLLFDMGNGVKPTMCDRTNQSGVVYE